MLISLDLIRCTGNASYGTGIEQKFSEQRSSKSSCIEEAGCSYLLFWVSSMKSVDKEINSFS